MNNLPKRKPNRLKGYDYSQDGAYFITICAKDKKCRFGRIEFDSVGADIIRPLLSKTGVIAKQGIENIAQIYSNV
ncbi:MAG: hypothetical protein LBG97_01785, partial [Coriobacteriales bacterium]|nr:hypothetical protein [Coriobacteriales bacterium]